MDTEIWLDEIAGCLASNGRLCSLAAKLLRHARVVERRLRGTPDAQMRRAARRSVRRAERFVVKAFDARLLLLRTLGHT
jgi:hypothetical protein